MHTPIMLANAENSSKASKVILENQSLFLKKKTSTRYLDLLESEKVNEGVFKVEVRVK